MAVLDEVLVDLRAECDQLSSLVVTLGEEEWRSATPAVGWDIATTIAHLAWTDEVAVIAATDEAAWNNLVERALQDPTGFVDAEAFSGAESSGADISSRWDDARMRLQQALRDFPEGERMPWFGPPMSPASMATARFMETWSHGLDVADALGVTSPATDRIRHVTHLGVRTRNYSFINNGMEPPTEEFRVELVSPSGQRWEWGSADASQSLSGSALDFCLLVTHRGHRDDLDLIASGNDVERWLSIAQAFAGPPGEGRAPRR